jgi:hypothetical protein
MSQSIPRTLDIRHGFHPRHWTTTVGLAGFQPIHASFFTIHRQIHTIARCHCASSFRMRHSSKTIFSLEEPQLSDFTKDHSGRSLSVMTKRQGARLAKQDYPFFNKRWRDFKSDKEEDEQATLEHSFQSQLMIAASPSDDIEQAPTSIDQSLPVHESEQDESTGEASDSDSSTSDDR